MHHGEFCLCDPGSALSEDLLKRAALPVLDDPEELVFVFSFLSVHTEDN